MSVLFTVQFFIGMILLLLLPDALPKAGPKALETEKKLCHMEYAALSVVTVTSQIPYDIFIKRNLVPYKT